MIYLKLEGVVSILPSTPFNSVVSFLLRNLRRLYPDYVFYTHLMVRFNVWISCFRFSWSTVFKVLYFSLFLSVKLGRDFFQETYNTVTGRSFYVTCFLAHFSKIIFRTMKIIEPFYYLSSFSHLIVQWVCARLKS